MRFNRSMLLPLGCLTNFVEVLNVSGIEVLATIIEVVSIVVIGGGGTVVEALVPGGVGVDCGVILLDFCHNNLFQLPPMLGIPP